MCCGCGGEFLLNEFWHFCARLAGPRNVVNTHANAQTESVFSFALTLMDNIWVVKKNENGWGPFSRHVCGSELKRSCAMDGNLLKNELQRRFMTIMESVNWVCEDAFKEEHEWVTQCTISEQEDRILADLGYNFDDPCVIQWALLWFSAPSRSSLYHEDNGTHIEVYHEVTNLAIRRACGVPNNGNYNPRSYLVE